MNKISRLAGPAGPILQGMGADIILPLAVYYGLHAFGADNWVALLASTIVAGARTIFVALRQRRLNPFSTLMLVVFGVGLLLAFVTGDPRLMILKDSVVTAVVGVFFLVSTLRGRPLTLEADRAWSPDRAADIDRDWREDPATRHGYRITSMVWGLGMLAEASLRVVLVFLLPVSVMVGLSSVMWIAAVVLLVLWTRWYSTKAE
jgi:hypothetical protein